MNAIEFQSHIRQSNFFGNNKTTLNRQTDSKQNKIVVNNKNYRHIDNHVFFIKWIVKVFRILWVWIILYIMSNVYQVKFVSNVLAHDHGEEYPYCTMLIYMMGSVMIAELIIMFLTFLLLYIVRINNISDTFSIDKDCIIYLIQWFLGTWFLMTLIGICIAYNLHVKSLRFGDQGNRGIRAFAIIVFWVYIILICMS